MYLKDTREWLDELLEQKEQREKSGGDNDKANTEERWQIQIYSPMNDVLIGWTYTIDLDYEVFHVDSYPLFKLSCLPSDEEFEYYIDSDSYGHRAYRRDAPSRYRYNWTSPPPDVPSAVLNKYQASGAIIRDVHQVLGVPENLSDVEAARKDVYQIVIGTFMHADTVGVMMRELEKMKHPSQYRPNTFFDDAYRILLSFPIGPMLLDPITEEKMRIRPLSEHETYEEICNRKIENIWDQERLKEDIARRRSKEAPDRFPVDIDGNEQGVKPMWLHPRLCVQLAAHLNDQDNLKAAVVSLESAILENPMTKDCPSVYFGVACSFFHCAIISVDTTRPDSASVMHTPALQFLPGYYATSPETPGITALTRLGFYISFQVPLLQPAIPGRLPSISTSDTLELPVELWEHIVSYTVERTALISLTRVSRISREAVKKALRWPRIKYFTILSGVSETSTRRGLENPITSITVISTGETADLVPSNDKSVPDRFNLQSRLYGGDFFAELRHPSGTSSFSTRARFYLFRLPYQKSVKRNAVVEGCIDFEKDLDGLGRGDANWIFQPQGHWRLTWAVYDGLRFRDAKKVAEA